MTRDPISEAIEAMEALERAATTVTVFVTSRERIKEPEGVEWWAEERAQLRAALDGLRRAREEAKRGWYGPGGMGIEFAEDDGSFTPGDASVPALLLPLSREDDDGDG